MSGIPKIGIPPAALWIGVCCLLTLGLLTTAIDLSTLPAMEAGRANADHQRFLVNPATGQILMSAPKASETAKHEAENFDVGTAEEATKPEPTTPEAAQATATPAEPTPQAPPASMPKLRTEPMTTSLEMPTHTEHSLVGAPAPEVTETVDGAKLPKRGDNDVIPASLYAHPFKRQPDQILISFLITDMGLDPQSIGLVLSLPSEVSIAYSAYTRPETSYSEHLRAAGHEVWMMLPTMTENYPSDDPGPLGIVSAMPSEELIRRLREILSIVPGSIGVVLPPNETASDKKGALEPIVKEVNARGLYMLTTHPSHPIAQITSDKNLYSMLHRADLVLDPEPDEPKIRSRLAGLVDAATEKGEYLVLVSARPQSLKILAEWLKETKFGASIAIAPVSALYTSETTAEEPEAAEGGHGGGEKKKEKKKPKPKAPKVLPQDKYKQPAAGAEGGGHGGGH